jgi:hypothetical protein
VGTAAVNKTDRSLRHGLAKLSRGGFINEAGALGGAAIDANVSEEAGAGLDDDVLRCHGLVVARRPLVGQVGLKSEGYAGHIPVAPPQVEIISRIMVVRD